MAIGTNRLARAAVDPLVSALYPLPNIAILPLILILFGLGEGSKIAIVAFGAFFPAVINAMTGAQRRADPARRRPQLRRKPAPDVLARDPAGRDADRHDQPAPQPRHRPRRHHRGRVRRRQSRPGLPDLDLLVDARDRADVRR